MASLIGNMFVVRLFSTIVVGIFLIVSFWIGTESIRFLPLFVGASIAVAAAGERFVTRRPMRAIAPFVVSVVNITAAGWGVMFFIPQQLFVGLVAGIVGGMVFLYLFASFYYFSVPWKYQPHALDSIGTYMGITAFFFYMSSLFGLSVFLPQPAWIIIGFVLLLSALSGYMVWWSNQVFDRLGIGILVAFSLVMGEFFWAISQLPVSLFVQGAAVTVVFYFFAGILRAYGQGRLGRAVMARYAAVSASVWAALFLTARWI